MTGRQAVLTRKNYIERKCPTAWKQITFFGMFQSEKNLKNGMFAHVGRARMEYRSKKCTVTLWEDFLPSRNEFYDECGISTSGKVQSRSGNSNFNIF